MMTLSNWNIFRVTRVTGPLCGEFTGHRWISSQRPVTRSFHVFFDLRLNKRLSKQPRGWWFETSSRWLWRHCSDFVQRAHLCLSRTAVVSCTNICSIDFVRIWVKAKRNKPRISITFAKSLMLHYNDVIMSVVASQITSASIVCSTVGSGGDQENINAPRHWPLCTEYTGDRWIPAHKASNAENVSIWWRHHGAF